MGRDIAYVMFEKQNRDIQIVAAKRTYRKTTDDCVASRSFRNANSGACAFARRPLVAYRPNSSGREVTGGDQQGIEVVRVDQVLYSHPTMANQFGDGHELEEALSELQRVERIGLLKYESRCFDAQLTKTLTTEWRGKQC